MNFEEKGTDASPGIIEEVEIETQAAERADGDTDDNTSEHHYVSIVIVENRCHYMFLERNQTGLCLPKFSSDRYSPVTSLGYRSELSHRFHISINTHLVGEATFQEYRRNRNQWVTLVIVEVATEQLFTPGELVRVGITEALDEIVRTCEHSAVAEHLRLFVSQSMSDSPKKDCLPWYNLGYYGKAFRLIETILENTQYFSKKVPEQFRFSIRSVVYRIPTPPGFLFFKVTRPESNEIRRTEIITRLFPDFTATLVALRANLDVIITSDFGPPISHLCFGSPAVGYEDFGDVADRILRQWATMQQRSIPHLEELRSAGLPLYDAKWIFEGFEDVLVFIAEHKLLSADKLKCLRSCHPHLERTFDLWQLAGLPNTLVHGDLNETNIAQPNGPESSFTFFDWDSAFIGNPFFDLLDSEWHPLFSSETAYLESWTEYADLQTITKTATWTKPLEDLVSAIAELYDNSLPLESRKELVKENAEDFIEGVYNLQNE